LREGEDEGAKGRFVAAVKAAKRAVFRIETARKLTQLGCFLLFNAALFGLGPWPVLLPVLQSLGTPHKTVGEAFGSLQSMLYEAVFPWLPLASILLAAVVVGRALCGWACPFGFVQDLLSYIKRKHTRVSSRTHMRMIKAKHVVLAATLLISGTLAVSSATGAGEGYRDALGVFAQAPFNALSPSDTLFAVLPRVMLNVRYAVVTPPETAQGASGALFAGILSMPTLFWVRLAIMVGVLVLAAYVPRSWCRYFCPQGAMLALMSRFGFLGLRRDPLKCTRAGCRACVEVCPMRVPILDLPWEKFSGGECILCLKCVEACPEGALKPKFP